jgi:hypothetical protein
MWFQELGRWSLGKSVHSSLGFTLRLIYTGVLEG